jgi:SNF2 family DNA or RNA helicase
MAVRKRGEIVKQFQEDEKTRVFLISIKAGGVGLNLTEADYVFILDPWWNPAVEQQAIDRTHRIGQTKNVFIYKFITKDSVEEKILALQQRKLKLSNALITTEESFIKSLSAEDIREILG